MKEECLKCLKNVTVFSLARCRISVLRRKVLVKKAKRQDNIPDLGTADFLYRASFCSASFGFKRLTGRVSGVSCDVALVLSLAIWGVRSDGLHAIRKTSDSRPHLYLLLLL